MYTTAPGTTDYTVYFKLRSAATGQAATGLAYNSSGASAYFTRTRGSATSITLATQTVTGSHSDGGFVEVDGTNAKGLYRLDLPDAAVAADVPFVLVSIEFDDVIEETLLIELKTVDVNVTQFLGTTITESNGGDVANNFSQFYDVNPTTSNTVDDVGGGGSSITDIIKPTFLVPPAIDIADTATVRIGIHLTNMLDDLPSTAEITPGTIAIHRKAAAGTTWVEVVAATAMSETAGLIYYDASFPSASGYERGDIIRFTFAGQTVTVSANDYQITPAGGIYVYSWIPETNGLTAALIADAVLDEALSGHATAGTLGAALNNLADTIWDEVMESGAPSNAQTARHWMRLMASAMFGADAEAGDWSALAINGGKTRIAATLSATGARSSIDTLDGS